MTFGDGEPEPHGAIIQRGIDDFAAGHPKPSDIALVVEVSDTTLDRDRGIKLRSYARAGIPCYWMINLVDLQVEVNTVPMPDEKVPRYRDVEVLTGEKLIPLMIEGGKVTAFPANTLLPPV